eukprot:84567-Rhodomonas_salina.1
MTNREIHWNNNQIPVLQGSEIAATDGIKKYAHLTTEQHQAWASSVSKKLAEHGIEWIPTMASQLMFADGSFSPVSTCFPDKYNSCRYQREIVNRAIKAGCDSLPCP